jgi:hypothetical protein
MKYISPVEKLGKHAGISIDLLSSAKTGMKGDSVYIHWTAS